MCQYALNGYYVKYESKDSVIHFNEFFSTEKFDSEGRSIYKKYIPFTNHHESKTLIEYTVDSNTHARESIIGGDTARYLYIDDLINQKFCMITGGDTTFIYKIIYDENNRTIGQACLFGCQYRTTYNYNNTGNLISTETIYENGKSSYDIWKYDELDRQTHFFFMVSSLSDTLDPDLIIIYDDSLNTKTEINGSIHWKNKTVETTFFDSNNRPYKQEITSFLGELEEKRVIEFRIE